MLAVYASCVKIIQIHIHETAETEEKKFAHFYLIYMKVGQHNILYIKRCAIFWSTERYPKCFIWVKKLVTSKFNCRNWIKVNVVLSGAHGWFWIAMRSKVEDIWMNFLSRILLFYFESWIWMSRKLGNKGYKEKIYFTWVSFEVFL